MPKRYEGLLTVDEAIAAIRSGYDGRWIVFGEGQAVCDIREVGGEWRFYYGSLDWFTVEELRASLRGFAPLPGHYLPMECAPRDGREVLLLLPDRQVTIAHGSGSEWHREDGSFTPRPDSDFLGWAPIVTEVSA